MDNLEEMDRFLEKFNLPRLNQEEIEIMNNPITSTEIEAVIKKISPKNKTPYMLSTRDPPQNRGHIQTENEGLEKDLPFLNKKKIYGTLRRLKEGGA